MQHPPLFSSETPIDWLSLKERFRQKAKALGLGRIGWTHAEPAATLQHYEAWLRNGYHGEMAYLGREDRLARRRDLRLILPEVQSLIFVTLPYWPSSFPEATDAMRGVVSCYAWGRDYHDILGQKLKTLCAWLEQEAGGKTRYYIDTGAIQERDLGGRAGLGFVGKNTMLIDPTYGSGFFLGEILTTLAFPPDPPARMPSCGRCQRCLQACPTQAFVGPSQMDARRCISYLTIELKGSIPVDLRPLVGNWIYGCDVCQQVCPWMRFAGDGPSPLWGSPPEEVTLPKLLGLLALDEEGFQLRFAESPIRRIKRSRLLRNVAVALGNIGDPTALPALQRVLCDPEPLIQEHAAWAIRSIRQKLLFTPNPFPTNLRRR
ncbi:tRNA epoxyqueuosine(34) reductase QueG [Myxococcota bacterium]|nr:tRNA epoxyqueuosine(34) reductase QueG [Myxococcota bacterium]